MPAAHHTHMCHQAQLCILEGVPESRQTVQHKTAQHRAPSQTRSCSPCTASYLECSTRQHTPGQHDCPHRTPKANISLDLGQTQVATPTSAALLHIHSVPHWCISDTVLSMPNTGAQKQTTSTQTGSAAPYSIRHESPSTAHHGACVRTFPSQHALKTQAGVQHELNPPSQPLSQPPAHNYTHQNNQHKRSHQHSTISTEPPCWMLVAPSASLISHPSSCHTDQHRAQSTQSTPRVLSELRAQNRSVRCSKSASLSLSPPLS